MLELFTLHEGERACCIDSRLAAFSASAFLSLTLLVEYCATRISEKSVRDVVNKGLQHTLMNNSFT